MHGATVKQQRQRVGLGAELSHDARENLPTAASFGAGPRRYPTGRLNKASCVSRNLNRTEQREDHYLPRR